jgi:hypothetical protein
MGYLLAYMLPRQARDASGVVRLQRPAVFLKAKAVPERLTQTVEREGTSDTRPIEERRTWLGYGLGYKPPSRRASVTKAGCLGDALFLNIIGRARGTRTPTPLTWKRILSPS